MQTRLTEHDDVWALSKNNEQRFGKETKTKYKHDEWDTYMINFCDNIQSWSPWEHVTKSSVLVLALALIFKSVALKLLGCDLDIMYVSPWKFQRHSNSIQWL